MRYFGSKGSIVENIYRIVASRVPSGTFCDPFGGIGIVGQEFKANGYNVVSGDILQFAHCFQTAAIARSGPLPFRAVRKALGLLSLSQLTVTLNAVVRRDGWFVEEYAKQRKFFTIENAFRIQTCWRKINRWRTAGLTSEKEHSVLVASLVDSMDRVANTAGTYYAYLKTFHRKANKQFEFQFLPSVAGPVGVTILGDAKELVQRSDYDILYLDPPYNERDYAAYYHLPETMAQGRTSKLIGLSGIPRKARTKSRFTKPREAFFALSEVLSLARFRLLVFHYSDEGLVPPRNVRRLLRSLGNVEQFHLTALGYRTSAGRRETTHTLYLVERA